MVEGMFTNVAFAIAIETNSVTTNEDFEVSAVITNSSGVSIGKIDMDKTFLLLTDGRADVYEF